MNTHASTGAAPAARVRNSSTSPISIIVFVALLVAGIGFSVYSLRGDVTSAGAVATTWLPYLLLGVALLVALGFEFVNGFHDTANHSGLQMATVRNLVLAWVLTLPVAIVLSGSLYWLFSTLF